MDNTSDAENKAKKHRLESDSFVLDGDQKRLERKLEAVLTEVRRIKNSINHLEAELHVQEEEAQKLEREIAQTGDEMTHLKKAMNAL